MWIILNFGSNIPDSQWNNLAAKLAQAKVNAAAARPDEQALYKWWGGPYNLEWGQNQDAIHRRASDWAAGQQDQLLTWIAQRVSAHIQQAAWTAAGHGTPIAPAERVMEAPLSAVAALPSYHNQDRGSDRQLAERERILRDELLPALTRLRAAVSTHTAALTSADAAQAAVRLQTRINALRSELASLQRVGSGQMSAGTYRNQSPLRGLPNDYLQQMTKAASALADVVGTGAMSDGQSASIRVALLPALKPPSMHGALPNPGGYTGWERVITTPENAGQVRQQRPRLLTQAEQALQVWQARGYDALTRPERDALRTYQSGLDYEAQVIARHAPALSREFGTLAQALRTGLIQARKASAAGQPTALLPSETTRQLSRLIRGELANYTPATVVERIPLRSRAAQPKLTADEATSLRERLQKAQDQTGLEHGYLLARDYAARPGSPSGMWSCWRAAPTAFPPDRRCGLIPTRSGIPRPP